MKKKAIFLTALFFLLSFILSACIGLLPLDEEPATGDFGPKELLTDLQARSFEALWKQFQDNYIYYDTANVDWSSIHDQTAKRIQSGLTQDEFVQAMKDLQNELPEGSLLYQSRAERIDGDTTDTSTYGGIGAFVGFNETPSAAYRPAFHHDRFTRRASWTEGPRQHF